MIDAKAHNASALSASAAWVCQKAIKNCSGVVCGKSLFWLLFVAALLQTIFLFLPTLHQCPKSTCHAFSSAADFTA